jgi:DNA-binding winged helix-turn-helix (wHTH) protein
VDAVCFNDLIFSADMLSARRNDGTEIRFTRKERALLKEFVAKGNNVLTRHKLLEALHRDDQGDISERNIDFLVNRLRTKLGDKARDPRFIASQYGEGYVWIAEPIDGTRTNAFLQIGPVYGLTETDNGERAILDLLTTTLDSDTDEKAAIVCTPALQPYADQAPLVGYGLEASFYKDDTHLHAAFVLRHGLGRQAISTFRTSFANGDDYDTIRDLAINVQRALWAHMAMPASPPIISPSDIPLEIRIHDAARTLAPSSESWRESEARIEAARVAAPDEPTFAIMRGLALYARLLLDAGEGKEPGSSEWREIEKEIEALALASLPKIQDNPLLVLGAAKLLLFVDRGHFDLAERLAENTFASSGAFAAAFSTLAQLRMYRGRIQEALTFYDKGIELAKYGSEFHIYLLSLKCRALLAANNRVDLERSANQLYAAKPLTRVQVGLFLAPLGALPADLEMLLFKLTRWQARRLACYLYYVSARHFQVREHRENTMRGLLFHLRRRFGDDILPGEIAETLPDMMM